MWAEYRVYGGFHSKESRRFVFSYLEAILVCNGMHTYIAKLPQFEGPLDLLLELIEKNKLHINDISLSQVTDDYVAQVKQMEQFSLAGVAHFVLIASTLLLIKSKSLLPGFALTPEEERDIEELQERLRLYQIIKRGAAGLKQRYGQRILFEASERRDEPVLFTPEPTMTPHNIHELIRGVILRMPVKEFLPKKIVEKILSLEEMIERMLDRIQTAAHTSFNEFSKRTHATKGDVIVSFLALLELVKREVVEVNQELPHADIHIESKVVGTPRYL